uniref:Barttin n=1 Tax=Petromyzon marinus TaxID=7757 RepID=A0AAJ7XAA4_PETMA|nr:barttin [Petromyzon marinus]
MVMVVVNNPPQGPVREATLRYGLVSVGLFLAALGALLSGGEWPHVYGTFCALGALLTAAGVAWSLCQCYPKVVFNPIHESDSLPFLLDPGTKPRTLPLACLEGSTNDRGQTSPTFCSSSWSTPPNLTIGTPPPAPRGPPTSAPSGKGARGEVEEVVEEEVGEEVTGCSVQVHSDDAQPDPASPAKPPRYEEVLGGSVETAPHCPLCRAESMEGKEARDEVEEDDDEEEEEEVRCYEEAADFGASLREADNLAREIDSEIDREVHTERDTVSLISETT